MNGWSVVGGSGRMVVFRWPLDREEELLLSTKRDELD